MILRRDLITMLGGAAFAWPLAVRAQQPGRIYRVGYLSPNVRNTVSDALYDALGRLGFVEGQNIEIDARGYGLRPEQLAPRAAELVAAKVDVIICGGAAAIRAAQQATTTIPILGTTDDMVGEGLVRSLARPDGNTTGISLLGTELDGKRQELLIELLPGARRIAALADSLTTAPDALRRLQDAARARGVELVIETVRAPEEIAPAIAAAKEAGAAGLHILQSALLFANRRIIFERTAALGLPVVTSFPQMVQDGGLVGYGSNIVQIHREQVSRLLAELLRGKKPADLPIEQPSKFELVINLKTAKALGLTVPASLLARADEVIE